MTPRDVTYSTLGNTIQGGDVVAPVPFLTFIADDAATVGLAANGSITNNGIVASGPWSIPAVSGVTVSPSSGSSIAAGAVVALTFATTQAGTTTHTLTCDGATIIGSPQQIVSVVAPTLATLTGSETGITGTAVIFTVTLDALADQTYTITPSATNSGIVSPSTRTIPAGGTAGTFTVTDAVAETTSVDFTISPSITRAGRPISLVVASGALPSLTLSAVSATGNVSAPGSATVSNDLVTSCPWTLTPSAGMTATPSSGTLAAGASVSPVLAYSTTGTKTLALSNGSGGTVSGSPASITVSASLATSATLALANSGATGVAITGTVTLNGIAPSGGSVSIAGPGATITPNTLSWTSGESGAAKSFTVLRATNGTTSVSISNNMGLANAGTPVSYTSSAATVATLALSTAGTTGASTTGTVTLNGTAPAAGSITISGSGATITPSTLSWTVGESGAAKTFTIQRATDGTTSVSISSGIAGVTVAGTPLSHTTSTVASSGTPSPFTLTSSTSQVAPFCIGYPIRQGDVPAGSGIAISGATAQATINTTWPDGSAKHAIIAGTATLIANTPLSISVAAGAASTGTALTTTDLATALSAGIAFTAGAFGGANFSGSDWLSPQTVIATGHRMSSWAFRKAIGSDAHLVAWVEVRLFAGGAVEVFPWIENGYLGVASPTNKSETYTFTMGGTLRFSQAIDIKHHTRIPLVNTSTGQGDARTFSHWLGTSPGVVPAHDGAYLRATKVIPNAYWATPSDTVLNAAQQNYTPNTLANDTNATAGAGGSGAIIHATDARYVNSGDVRAWKAMMAHALSAGSWSWHFRDSSTQLPALYASYASVQIGDVAVPAGSGGTNHGAGPGMSHMASYAYLPFLVTGRWWFLEELQFQATWGFLSVSPSYRGNGTPAIDTGSGYTVRGGAWSMNLAAQAASITPSSHALSAQFIATWERTTALLYGKYVSGTIAAGAWVSPLGVLGSYSGDVGAPTPWAPPTVGTAWWDAMYQHNYVAMVLGYSSDIGIAQSGTSLANHVAVRNHSYKLVIGRADDGYEGRYNWRRFISFASPIGTDALGTPLDAYYSTHAQMYAEALAGYSLASIPSNLGLSLKQHSSDTDLTGSDTSRNYGSTALAALAMAVEHGVSGASEGYARVTSASNFTSSFASYVTDDEPGRSVRPRLPFTIPAVGTISDVVTTPATMVAALGHNGNFMNAFGGIIWAPGLGALGSTLVLGGGHGDGGYNSIARYDIATRTWTRIKDAAPIYNKFVTDGRPNANALYCAHPDNGWMYSNNNTADFESVTVGELAAVHSHTAYAWMPQKANPAVTAADGFLFMQGLGGFYESGQRSNSGTNRLTLGSQLWTRIGADLRPETYLSFYAFGAYSQPYDPKRNLVWGKLEFTPSSGGAASLTIASKDPVTAAFTGYTMTAGSGAAHLSEYNVLEYSARHDCLINMAGANIVGGRDYTRLHVYDLAPATKVSYTPPQTGTVPTTLLDHTVRCWCDSLNAVALLNGTGADQNIHFLKPTGDPRTAAWAWSSQAITGTIRPVAGIGNGTPGENKLRHIPGLSEVGGKQVFLYFSRDQDPPQIIVTNAP